MKYIALFVTTLMLLGCSSTKKTEKTPDKVFEISLIQLIANPEKYHKKRVKVEGYFYYEKEGNAIYVTKSDFENLIFKNGVYLYVTSDFLKSLYIEQPYKGYMSIEGVFNKDKLGWGNLYSGTIDNVISMHRLFKRGSETDEYNIQ